MSSSEIQIFFFFFQKVQIKMLVRFRELLTSMFLFADDDRPTEYSFSYDSHESHLLVKALVQSTRYQYRNSNSKVKRTSVEPMGIQESLINPETLLLGDRLIHFKEMEYDSDFKFITLTDSSESTLKKLRESADNSNLLLAVCFPCSKEWLQTLCDSIPCIAYAWRVNTIIRKGLSLSSENIELSQEDCDSFFHAISGLILLMELENAGYF